MKPVLLSENMLYDFATLLARQILGFVAARHLGTIYGAAHPVKPRDYRAHADLQATLRSLCPDWRWQAIAFMRRVIREERRTRGSTPDFQTWLARVQDCDAANGHVTAYTPHQPGLFLKPDTEAKVNATTAAAHLERSRQAESALLRPLRQRAAAKCPPTASPMLHAESDAAPTAPASTEPGSCKPCTGAGSPTTSIPASSPATCPDEPTAGTLNPPPHAPTPHAPEMPLASDHLVCGHTGSATAQPPQSHDEAGAKNHSSAQPSDGAEPATAN